MAGTGSMETELLLRFLEQAPSIVGFLLGLILGRKWQNDLYKELVETKFEGIKQQLQVNNETIKEFQKEITALTKSVVAFEAHLKSKDYRGGAI